jgi:hypothetical protein
LEVDDALVLGAGREVDVDFFVLAVGRAGRDDPDGDFDIVFSVFSYVCGHGDRARVPEGSKWRPQGGFLG